MTSATLDPPPSDSRLTAGRQLCAGFLVCWALLGATICARAFDLSTWPYRNAGVGRTPWGWFWIVTLLLVLVEFLEEYRHELAADRWNCWLTSPRRLLHRPIRQRPIAY